MSIFSKVLNKLGIKKDKPEEKEVKEAPAAKPMAEKPVKKSPISRKHSDRPIKRISQKPTAQPAATPAEEAVNIRQFKESAVPEMEMVDVMSKLETMSKGSGLNWKQSIVDLLKVLDIDSSLASRKELAKELACPEDLMGDSAKMNTWLHKTVLQKIAENGGNLPQSLLD